jgi:hypothetical protein
LEVESFSAVRFLAVSGFLSRLLDFIAHAVICLLFEVDLAVLGVQVTEGTLSELVKDYVVCGANLGDRVQYRVLVHHLNVLQRSRIDVIIMSITTTSREHLYISGITLSPILALK